MNLAECSKGVATPCVTGPMQAGKIDMDGSGFRMLAARCNYLAMDRPDMQYAVK